MASYHHLLQHTKPRFESPAKVFAKLKSKVQREAMDAKEGIFTSEDPLFGEKHGAEFISPRKKARSNWTSDELKENHRFGSYRSDAQALTLSPISSPQKTFGCLYSDISRKPLEETPPEDEPGRGRTRRESAFLESTAMSQPYSLVNRSQILKEPRQIMDGFTVCNRTPVKIQPVSDHGLFKEECAPLNPPMSPANMFSPMRKRLMKRKLDHHEFDKVISSTEEINNEAPSQLLDLTASAFSEDNSRNKTKDLGCVRKCSVDQLQMIHEVSLPPPRSIAEKRCNAIMATLPPLSPAKMFAYMKERESKKELQKDCNSSRRDLFNVGNVHRSRDTPLSTDHSMGVMEGAAFRSAPASVVPSNRCKVDSPDSQSDADLSEDVINPTGPPQPVLLEDPLVLNSPQVSIPKKHETAFKRNKWPKQENFPSESVIYLKKWFLRKNPKGLFVDGIHREDNIPWNSNIIVERVSSSVLKTVSGRVYILVGKMKMDVASDFPKWFLKKFANGFPLNWKALYEKLLSEPRDRETEKGKGITAKAKSEASSINHRVTRDKQKALRTSDSCPPSSSSSTKVSRSGRVIKPPLEYWKGGRVFLDAFMNVTIHECYDTSICKPAVTTTVPARKSQKPISVFLPSGEGWKQSGSANKEGAPVLRRRVKPPNHTRAKIEPDQKPSSSPEPVVETLTSPEEWCGRTRSSQRGPAKGRELNVDTLPQNQCELEKSSTQRSKKQTHNTDRPSVRASGRKRTVINSPESPSILPSDDDFPVARQTRGKGVYSKKSRNVHKKSPPNRVSSSKSSSESSEERGRNKTTRVTKKRDEAQTKHKPSKYTKPSPPTKPRLTQSGRKHKAVKGSRFIPQEQDMDEWTEEELLKLREAVSYYPKHMAGYWEKVARMVGTRSTEECYNQHTSQATSQTPAKKAKKPKNEKVEAAKPPVADIPLISARMGTLKRKQQVRQFLENMPKEDVDDVFSSAYMQNKRFEMPSLCLSEDHNCTELEPMTPMSSCFSEVKTPQCLYITPGMMGSPNRNDDKYVYQLQKRMKKKQFNVCKRSSPSKNFTPTPSVKRTMRRCGNTENDTFVVWELFPGHGEAPTESEEEEDFYFSDNN